MGLYTTLCTCIDRLNPEESTIFFEAHPELARFDPRDIENSNSALPGARSRSRSPMFPRRQPNPAVTDLRRPPRPPRTGFSLSRADGRRSEIPINDNDIPGTLTGARNAIDDFETWFRCFELLPGTPDSLGRQFRMFMDSLQNNVGDQLDEARIVAQDRALDRQRETISRQSSRKELKEADKCPLCFDLVADMKMDCCGQRLCEICLKRHQLRDPRCPYCRATGDDIESRQASTQNLLQEDTHSVSG